MDGPQTATDGALRTAEVICLKMNEPSQATGDRTAHNVSLVVVTHNSRTVITPLLGCLAAPRSSVFGDIVFVDNASIDGTVELIRKDLHQARVIVNQTNRGFAAAVNQGVRECSGRSILLANPDVVWNGGTAETLVRFLDTHARAAAVCPRLVFPDGRPQPSVRRFPTYANIWLSRQSPLRFLRPLLPERLAYTQSDPVTPSCIEAVSATFMVIRRAAFDAVGGMKEQYFLYVEDTDLCKRWHDGGWEVWIDPHVSVLHNWQGGSGRSPHLRRLHRAGIRRYFHDHHPDAPIRNLLLNALLSSLDVWDRVFHRDSKVLNS